MWSWVSGSCVVAGAAGLLAMRWQLALAALPAFAIEAIRARSPKSREDRGEG